MLLHLHRTNKGNLDKHLLDRIRIYLRHEHARFHLCILDNVFPRKHAVPFDINIAEVTQVHRVEALHVEAVRPEGNPGGNQKDAQNPATTLEPAENALDSALHLLRAGLLPLAFVVADTATQECRLGFGQMHSSKILVPSL